MMNDDNAPKSSHNPYKKSGRAMLFLFWGLVLLLSYTFFQWQYNQDRKSESYRTASGAIELHIPLTRQNTYEVSGQINGTQVQFLIDTGATSIAIPEKIANEINLQRGMPINVETAGGIRKAYLTRIDTLYIGTDIVIRNVPATINIDMPGSLILLGMGALKQLKFLQTENKLILRQE